MGMVQRGNMLPILTLTNYYPIGLGKHPVLRQISPMGSHLSIALVKLHSIWFQFSICSMDIAEPPRIGCTTFRVYLLHSSAHILGQFIFLKNSSNLMPIIWETEGNFHFCILIGISFLPTCVPNHWPYCLLTLLSCPPFVFLIKVCPHGGIYTLPCHYHIAFSVKQQEPRKQEATAC